MITRATRFQAQEQRCGPQRRGVLCHCGMALSLLGRSSPSSHRRSTFSCPHFQQRFLLMGRDIIYNNIHFPDRAAGKEQCAHAVSGDYGGCDSARAAWLGSHAARGGHGGRSSGSTMRVVVVARLARCARSRRCSWRFATIIILAPHPQYYLFTWLPHQAPQAV